MELDPAGQSFVEAVMLPLGDDPARRDILETAFATTSVFRAADPVRLEAAVGRMRATAPGFPRNRWISGAVVAVAASAAIWLALLGPAARRSIDSIWVANQWDNIVGTIASRPAVPSVPRPSAGSGRIEDDRFGQILLDRLPTESRLLLVGDLKADNLSDRWRAVREKHPDDPAHFHAWALAYRYENSTWPSDYVETGARLDSENGMFLLMSAAARMKQVIVDDRAPRITRAERLAARAAGITLTTPPRPVNPPRVIIDPKAFEAAWSDFERSLSMPDFDDYASRLNLIRQQCSPPPVDYPDVVLGQLLTYAQPEDYSSGWVELSGCVEAFALAADEAARFGDRERLDAISALLVRTSRRLCESSSGMIPALVSRGLAKKGAEAVAKAWHEIGDTAKAVPFEKLASNLDRKIHPVPKPPPDALSEFRGSSLTILAETMGRGPTSPPVTESDLRGGRMAEYSMYERLMLHAIAALLVIPLLFLLLAPLRQREKFGPLPARLAGLLDGRDHAWIMTLGVALPFAIYLVSTRAEWMAPRELGLSGQRFLLWATQALALVIAIVDTVLQAARWRLGRRGGILALGWIGPDPGRIFAPLALTTIPLASLLPRFLAMSPIAAEWVVASVWIMTGLALVWPISLAAGTCFGPPERELQRRVQMASAGPAVALALVIAAAAIPVVYQEEKQWVAQLGYEALKDGRTVFAPRHESELATWLARDALRHLNELD